MDRSPSLHARNCLVPWSVAAWETVVSWVWFIGSVFGITLDRSEGQAGRQPVQEVMDHREATADAEPQEMRGQYQQDRNGEGSKVGAGHGASL
jgi:hypothetical protein